MLRTTVVDLLIAVLLTCPYGCLGASAQRATAQLEPAGGCGCCKHERPARDETPQPPRDDAAPDCICHGAVFDGPRVSIADTHAAEFVAAALNPNAESAIATCRTLTDFERSHHFPPLSTGREICALICVLLR